MMRVRRPRAQPIDGAAAGSVDAGETENLRARLAGRGERQPFLLGLDAPPPTRRRGVRRHRLVDPGALAVAVYADRRQVADPTQRWRPHQIIGVVAQRPDRRPRPAAPRRARAWHSRWLVRRRRRAPTRRIRRLHSLARRSSARPRRTRRAGDVPALRGELLRDALGAVAEPEAEQAAHAACHSARTSLSPSRAR